jgi:hypothetical protein
LRDWSISTGERVFWKTKQAKAPTDLTSDEAAVVSCSISGVLAEREKIRSLTLIIRQYLAARELFFI